MRMQTPDAIEADDSVRVIVHQHDHINVFAV